MTRNMQKIMSLTRALRVSGLDQDKYDETLKNIIVCLADEVIHLTREIETVRAAASRAERMGRMYRG